MAGTGSRSEPPATATDGSPSVVVGPATATLELSLPQSARAPSLARQALRQWIAGLGCTDELVENATLLVSEAVTNAVVHAGSRPRLLITTVDGRLRIEVHDASHVVPVIRAPDDDGIGGHGLRILACVADEWGWSTTSTGKFVWTEQRLVM